MSVTLEPEQMGWVRELATCFKGKGLPLEDLLQEGVVGLLEALQGYDPAKGPLKPYARTAIRRHLQRAIGKHNDFPAESLDQRPEPTMPEPAPPDVDPLFRNLSEVEEAVLRLYHGFGGPELSFADIGKYLGFSRQRACDIYQLALEKMRNEDLVARYQHFLERARGDRDGGGPAGPRAA